MSAALSLSGASPVYASPSKPSAYAEDRRAILALRAASNRALAAHDVEGAMAVAADDYVTVGGDGSIERGAAENRQGWVEEFATPSHDRYVRTPAEVEIGQRKGVLRAAELGRWEGINHKPAGEARPFGRYFVHWTKASGVWRAVSETYVTLGCRGPGC
ncbi:MAG: hypothetical protein JWP49_1776 [Phenylobacterium sp.]|nr:hypothetical protein [Phenylobacterium sp.]